jgi:hypothetical protein
MEKIIVYLDDADHARQVMGRHAPPAGGHVHWVLVACAPRMTHRISKWVSHRARENWRHKWSDKLFASVVPPLVGRGDQATPVLATGPLTELTEQLLREHGQATRVVDARRPKFDPSSPAQPAPGLRPGPWPISGMIAGMGLLLALAFE